MRCLPMNANKALHKPILSLSENACNGATAAPILHQTNFTKGMTHAELG